MCEMFESGCVGSGKYSERSEIWRDLGGGLVHFRFGMGHLRCEERPFRLFRCAKMD